MNPLKLFEHNKRRWTQRLDELTAKWKVMSVQNPGSDPLSEAIMLKKVAMGLIWRHTFRLRGSGKPGGDWTSVCLVHNIKKIYGEIMAKGGSWIT